ncbi:MAG: AAA family ATPase [Actinobacteria bacterium]|nr:AAA family ATPase [Actinomycetota bacterium]
MKLAISGKGGTGKTTLAALLARFWAEQGKDIIAVDADPDANLAGALGLSSEKTITPISDMRQFILDRTDAKAGYGSYFKLNPKVDDIPERFSHRMDGIRLLVLGGTSTGGAGCICPESALLKALVTHLLLTPEQIVILDMEAGVEHLGRATAQAVSTMIMVVEPGQRSIQTALNVKRLAAQIGITKVGAVINKVTEGLDIDSLAASLNDVPILGTLPYDPDIAKADLEGRSCWLDTAEQRKYVSPIAEALLSQS